MTQIKTVSHDATEVFTPWEIRKARQDFPILKQTVGGKPLVYLDNAASTQKPQAVIDAIEQYYSCQNANVHRGVYKLSQKATTLYEEAREQARAFLNAASTHEIIFTRGTTEAINLVAAAWGRANLKAGDEVVVSHLEHHSNIVPWQMVCQATGANLKVIPINDAGELVLEVYRKLLASGRVKMVAINQVSNSLGTMNPVKEMIAQAHQAGALVLIDGAQWVAHGKTDVRSLDADFYALSGHKLMGPMGIGVLYGKQKLLEAMPPYQGGGDMIETVSFNKTEYADLPSKFEAGTPHVAGAVGLAAAMAYLTKLGLEKIGLYEHALLQYATQRIKEVPGLRIIGTAERKSAVISFVIDGPPAISSMDIGVLLDREGICVRTGHHCCMPVMDRFAIASTARASFAFYNTAAEVDALVASLYKIVEEAGHRKPTAKREDAGDAGNEAVVYPPPSAPSVRAAAEALAEDLAFMGDRDAKNEYVLDLAERHPDLFNMLKQVTILVPGCMSQVYMVTRKNPASQDIFEFVADADAQIVRGLIALLQKLYSGQKAQEVVSFDVESFLNRIGLEQFITSQRRNGLAGMIKRIRHDAQVILDSRG